MPDFRLTHPALDFWIEVRVRQLNGRWLAVADLAGTSELGTGDSFREALLHALAPFGSVLAAELADRDELPSA